MILLKNQEEGIPFIVKAWLSLIFPIINFYASFHLDGYYWHIDYQDGITIKSIELKQKETQILGDVDYSRETININEKVVHLFSGRFDIHNRSYPHSN